MNERYTDQDRENRGGRKQPRSGGDARARQERARRKKRAKRIRRIALAVLLTVALIAAVLGGLWLYRRLRPALKTERYPVEYEEFIRASADENNIPPAYVAAVILAESSYNPEAVSYADARGLMQLLPDTAEWIAGRLGEPFSEESLFDPETNIRYGCWYLGFLMARYDADMRCSSAAYHAGQGTVDNWLKDPSSSPDGKTLAVIPSDATNTYVGRVLRYYEKYAEIYAKDDDAGASL